MISWSKERNRTLSFTLLVLGETFVTADLCFAILKERKYFTRIKYKILMNKITLLIIISSKC